MSAQDYSNDYNTTASGGIDFAYYENQARMARSRAFTASLPALPGFIRGLRARFSLPPALPAAGPVASACA